MKIPTKDDPIWILIAGSAPFALAAIVMFIACGYYLYLSDWTNAVQVGLNAFVASILPLGAYGIRKMGL